MNREISRNWMFLVLVEIFFLIQLMLASSSWAGSFRYPVDAFHMLRYERNAAQGEWYDYQPFGSLFAFSNKVHLGADINNTGGDAGAPVYAINDCTVDSWNDTATSDAWGKWLMIRCDASTQESFYLTDGNTVKTIYALYAHLGEIAVHTPEGIKGASVLYAGYPLKRGWRVGTIGNANGYYGSAYHLHFEIRFNGCNAIGAGYQDYNDATFLRCRTDPLEFIANNSMSNGNFPRVIVHPYDLDQSRLVSLALDANVWRRQGRTASDGTSSLGYGNYLWVTDSDKGSNASWYFTLFQEGWYDVFFYLPRGIASASQVHYTLWHEGTGYANPYQFTFSQTGLRNNQRIYIGRFKFSAQWRYDLIISGRSPDEGAKKIVIDALEVIPAGIYNLGGGDLSSIDQDQDMMEDDWERSVGLNPGDSLDASFDQDGDGLNALEEYRMGTLPFASDSDGDGVNDGSEVRAGTDPAVADSCGGCMTEVIESQDHYAAEITSPDISEASSAQHYAAEDTVGGCASGGAFGSILIIIPLLILHRRRM